MRRLLLLVVVVVVVVTAGCNGLQPGSDGSGAADTVTPVPITDGTSTPESALTPAAGSTLPPGVFANGSVDLAAVIDAHRATTSNRSYRLRIRLNETATSDESGVDGTGVESWDATIDVTVENGSEYVVNVTAATESATDAAYVDDSGHYAIDYDNGSANVREFHDTDADPYSLDPSVLRLEDGRMTLSPDEVDVSTVERDGETLYRIHVPSEPTIAPRSEYETYTAAVYVTPAGTVRAAHVELEHDMSRARVRERVRYAYSDVGEVTVTEPGWVSDAKAVRTAVNWGPREPTPDTDPDRTIVTSTNRPSNRTATSPEPTTPSER